MSEVLSGSLEAQAWDVRILDCMALLGSAGARVGDRVFRSLTSMPGVYDALHFAAFRRGSWPVRAIDREATRRLVPALGRGFDSDPVELIFATFATGASAAAKLRASGRSTAKIAVLCTDVDVYWLWVWDEVDLFLVTSRTAAATVRRYAPRAQVLLVPPPVRPAFYRAPDQHAARATLGIPHDAPCVLLMGGGWGLGPITGTARALADEGVHVLAVAGHNTRVESELRGAASTHLHPFGFTDRIPELMAAADLVITTPGATTSSEARVIGRALVLLDVLPGHGRENLQHELERGEAYATGPSPDEVRSVVLAALDDIDRPLATVVRPAGEWDEALQVALATLGLPEEHVATAPVAGADPGESADADRADRADHLPWNGHRDGAGPATTPVAEGLPTPLTATRRND